MDFHLSEDQLMLQSLVRQFAQQEIKPLAAEYDKKTDPLECFPWELWKKAYELGILGLSISQEWGGIGADLLTQVLVCEELGAGDGSFGCSVGTHLQKSHSLEVLLNDEQKARFIPAFMEDDSYIIASAMTEPETATDYLLPYDEPGVAMKTFAYLDGDEYVINGLKHFITHAAVAKLYVIWARTDKEKPITQALSAFLVPAGTPGLSIGHIDDSMGGRLEGRAEIILDEVRVPASNIIGKENEMFGPHMVNFLVDYLCILSSIIGEARTCYEETREFAKTRIQGGKPIIEHINIGTRLVDMLATIEACRSFVQKVACSWDNKHDFSPLSVHLAKAFVAEALSKNYLDTIEIWAGLGVQKEVPIERHFRNHFANLHGGGTPVLSKIKAMKLL